MAMEIGLRQIGHVSILDMRGKLSLGEGCEILRNQVKELLEKGEKSLLLNMADVTYMDSAGLGTLVTAYGSVNKAGGALKLLGVRKSVTDLLLLAKLSTLFEFYENQAMAVLSFDSPASRPADA